MDAIWIVYNDFGPKHRKNQKMLTQRPKNHDIVPLLVEEMIMRYESSTHTSEESFLQSPDKNENFSDSISHLETRPRMSDT